MNITTDRFQKFNPVFQSKTIAALISDIHFLEQIYDIVEPSYFESEAHQWVTKTSLWYYNTYKSLPTLEVFKQELEKTTVNDAIKVSIVNQLKQIWTFKDSNDLEYVQDEFLNFCKNQALKNAVLKSSELVDSGQYEQIRVTFDKALAAGQEKNIGHDWNLDVESRLIEQSRQVIPTPWPAINEILDGGIGKGEFMAFMAPSGAGKSWLLSKIGAHTVKLGFNVAVFTLELSERYTGNRYDTLLTNIPSKQLHLNKEVVKKIVSEVPGKLMIKYVPARMCSVATIRATLSQMKKHGFVPDLLLIDYPDLMRSMEKASAKHEELGYIYEEIRGLGGELDISIWGVSQTQRSALQDDLIDGDRVAGAYAKVHTLDALFSWTRKLEHKASNTGILHCIKNRFGPDGITFVSEANFERGVIDMFEMDSDRGKELLGQIEAGKRTLATANTVNARKIEWFSDTKEPIVYKLSSQPINLLEDGQK